MTVGEEGDNSEKSLEAYLNGSNYGGANSTASQTAVNFQSYAQMVANATATLRRESFTKRAGSDAVSGAGRAEGRPI